MKNKIKELNKNKSPRSGGAYNSSKPRTKNIKKVRAAELTEKQRALYRYYEYKAQRKKSNNVRGLDSDPLSPQGKLELEQTIEMSRGSLLSTGTGLLLLTSILLLLINCTS